MQTPETIPNEDFLLSEVEPVGAWDPTRKLLFAGHVGVVLGFLRFTPKWADLFDSFILVCRFDSMTSGQGSWRFCMVSGDDWKHMQASARFANILSYSADMFVASPGDVSLTLDHLYDETKCKWVEISFADVLHANGKNV